MKTTPHTLKFPARPPGVPVDEYFKILRAHQDGRTNLRERQRRDLNRSDAYITYLLYRQAHPLIRTNVETTDAIEESEYESASSVDSYYLNSTTGIMNEPNAKLDAAKKSHRKLMRAQVRECRAFEKKCRNHFK